MKVFVLCLVLLFAGLTVVPRGYAFKLPWLANLAASEQASALAAKLGVIRELLLTGTLVLGITFTTCVGCQRSQDTATHDEVGEQTELTMQEDKKDIEESILDKVPLSEELEYSGFGPDIDRGVQHIERYYGDDDDVGEQLSPSAVGIFVLPNPRGIPIPPPGYRIYMLTSRPPNYRLQPLFLWRRDLYEYNHPVPPPRHIYYIEPPPSGSGEGELLPLPYKPSDGVELQPSPYEPYNPYKPRDIYDYPPPPHKYVLFPLPPGVTYVPIKIKQRAFRDDE